METDWKKEFYEKMSKFFYDALTTASKFGAEMKGTQYEGMYPDKSVKLRDKAIEYTEELITSLLHSQIETLVGAIEGMKYRTENDRTHLHYNKALIDVQALLTAQINTPRNK